MNLKTGNKLDIYWNDKEIQDMESNLNKSSSINGLYIASSNKLTLAYINVEEKQPGESKFKMKFDIINPY